MFRAEAAEKKETQWSSVWGERPSLFCTGRFSPTWQVLSGFGAGTSSPSSPFLCALCVKQKGH